MTNESAFPNITNEELHISMSRYNFNGAGGDTCNNTSFGGADNITNTLGGGNITVNTTTNKAGG